MSKLSKLFHGFRRFRRYRRIVGRRAVGFHDDRVDGITDLLSRARGATILDIGCNRGLVALEFAANGAGLVHGCDRFADGVLAARQIFGDLSTGARFETVDLVGGANAIQTAFGADYLPQYDFVLFLDMYHHLKRQMPHAALEDLVRHLADKSARFFIIRTPQLSGVEPILKSTTLELVHFSDLPRPNGPVQVWMRR